MHTGEPTLHQHTCVTIGVNIQLHLSCDELALLVSLRFSFALGPCKSSLDFPEEFILSAYLSSHVENFKVPLWSHRKGVVRLKASFGISEICQYVIMQTHLKMVYHRRNFPGIQQCTKISTKAQRGMGLPCLFLAINSPPIPIHTFL